MRYNPLWFMTVKITACTARIAVLTRERASWTDRYDLATAYLWTL
jgi:hypothetical protein